MVVGAVTKDKRGEIRAVETVLAQLRAAIEHGGTPAKWVTAASLMSRHGIKPGTGQLLVFSEFADTARWLADRFADARHDAGLALADCLARGAISTTPDSHLDRGDRRRFVI